jgi:hypothetical protein
MTDNRRDSTVVCVAGIDEKMHEDRDESKAEIRLGQNSGVQIGTSKNGQAAVGIEKARRSKVHKLLNRRRSHDA